MPAKSANRRPGTRAFPHPDHDHARCAKQALARAESVCAERGTKLTEIRRRVLTAVWAGHAPVGAYDILARLNAGGGRTAPMAVYRALDFLMDQGLVHRLASLNAFIGCARTGAPHDAHFLICRSCRSAAEVEGPSFSQTMKKSLAAHRFVAEDEFVEIQGLCERCRKEGRA